jgi:hypothetical protein
MHAVVSGETKALSEPVRIASPDEITEHLSKGTANVALNHVPGSSPSKRMATTLEPIEEGKTYSSEQHTVLFCKGFNILIPFEGCSFPMNEVLIETIGRETFRLFIENGQIKVQCVSLGPEPIGAAEVAAAAA